MPLAPSAAQQAASRANGAASSGPATPAGNAPAAMNGTRHGLRGGGFALLPGEDAGGAGPAARGRRRRLAPARRLRAALGRASWSRRCGASSACAGWSSRPSARPRRRAAAVRGRACSACSPSPATVPGSTSDIGRALDALCARSTRRAAADLADSAACTDEPDARVAATAASRPAGSHGRTPEHGHQSQPCRPAARTRRYPERQTAASAAAPQALARKAAGLPARWPASPGGTRRRRFRPELARASAARPAAAACPSCPSCPSSRRCGRPGRGRSPCRSSSARLPVAGDALERAACGCRSR